MGQEPDLVLHPREPGMCSSCGVNMFCVSFRPFRTEEDEMPRNYRFHRQVEKRFPEKETREAVGQGLGSVQAPPGLRGTRQTGGNKALLGFFQCF